MWQEMIDSIPDILEYFVPGFFTMLIFRRIRDSKAHNPFENIHLMSCICISFVLRTLFIWVHNMYIRIIIECIVGLIAAIVFLRVLKNKKIRHLYSKIYNTMLSETVLESIGLDRTSDDPYISVFLKDGSMVYGRCISIPSDYSDDWIAIDNYKTTGESFDSGEGKKDRWYRKENELASINHVIAIHISEVTAIAKHEYDEEDSKAQKQCQGPSKSDHDVSVS